MSRIVFDDSAWWQRPGWQLAAAAALSLVALVVWDAALAPVDHEPIALHTLAPPLVATRPTPPAAEAVAPAAMPSTAAASAVASSSPRLPPALSTMVAPGEHITTLGVPPGAEPVPAGPRAHDSETEN